MCNALRTNFLLFIFVFCGPAALQAQDPLPVTHLGNDHGLSNNSVRVIFRDHNGFMWFGTYDGLNRYDGYDFKVFRNRLQDTTSLPHNYIYSITEDLDHNLWVGTGQGIGIYNNLTARFLPAYCRIRETGRIEKITANVNSLKTDRQGNVLIGTNGWGLIVRYRGDELGVQLPVTIRGRETVDYEVSDMVIDEHQQVWIFIRNVGLCRYDAAGKRLRLVHPSLGAVTCAAADLRGSIWFGSKNGLYQFSIAAQAVTSAYAEQPGQLTSSVVTALSFDKGQDLWIGTEGGGVNILNLAARTFKYLLPGESPGALTSESVFTIYVDQDARKWLGTIKGGINIIDPKKSRFRTITRDPINPNSLINDFVSTFYEDDRNQLWIGTDGGGLSVWNRSRNQFSNYRHEAGNASSLSNNLVNSITRDYQNNIWIATFSGGVNRFNRARNSFQHYRCINPLNGRENESVWLLYEDRYRNLWATTFSDGKLYRYHREADRFEMFDDRLIDLIAITEDKAGRLWAGNSHQLVRIDRESKKHVYYEIGKPVRALYEDRNGHFWVGAEGGGLVLFDREKGQVAARYSDADGLCNNAVLNILEDNGGNLWLSTFNGLSRFDIRNRTFKNFYKSDGLQSNQFLYNSALKLSSGELVFGGVKGITLFHPDSLDYSGNRPSVVLTGLAINNQPVTLGGRYIEQTAGDQITALEIPYAEAALSVGFTALAYSAPDKISYAYFLEGWDKDWNLSGKNRTAHYTHLREGTYHLHIKATSTEGSWNGKETVIRITILPPWYRSIGAYVLYCLAGAALVYLYLRYKTRQTKLEYAVRLTQLKAEKEKELNERKLSFFTDISHEFRTPLTLIINPLADYLGSPGKGGDTGNLNTVYRNARRLLSLVDQLLLFQKADTQREQLKIVQLDFYSLCRDIYSSFGSIAHSKRIDFGFVCHNEALALYADREKLEIVLYNLLSNALKFTPEGGTILFAVTEAEETVTVTVKDSGPGIAPEIGDKLFERFYQVQGAKNQSKPGFGIGLYLVKHFVEKHKGRVSYESTPGLGTAFTVQLKKGAAHFASELIQEDHTTETLMTELVPEEESVLPVQKTDLENLISLKKSVLVVEDDGEIRQYVSGIFKDSFIVYEAESGEQGFLLAQENLPDIIISDVMMQEGTGIELCHRVKSDPALSHIPVILLTAVSSPEVKLKGFEQGADDYITKPFEKDLLVSRVANLLKSRTVLQQYFYNEITLRRHTLKVPSEYREFLERCIAIVESHLEDDGFTIKKLAQEIGMSHSNLYRKVKAISGQSVSAFVRFLRLRKAAALMISSNLNVNEAAFQVGISDIKYFRKQFQKLFGMNPSEYIRKYRAPFTGHFTLHEKVVKPGE